MSANLFGHVAPIPCLSLWEPWASLITSGAKRHETRGWSTRVRGLVAIHASKTKAGLDDAPDELCTFALGDDWRRTRPFGCVVAVAHLTGCYSTEHLTDARKAHGLIGPIAHCDELAGNYGPGRYGFRLDNVQALKDPLPLKGAQGFFRWAPPEDLEARLCPPADHAAMAQRWDAFRVRTVL